jgi:uncharacterized protein YgbK (DUF1537 family)
MQDHPLNPMTDPDLRRWLGLQTRRSVGHVPHRTVAEGPAAIREALAREEAAGHPYVVVDALADADLETIGAAIADDILLSGGSGIALGLRPISAQGLIAESRPAWRGEPGPAAALCGSCSRASREQIDAHRRAGHPVREVSAEDVVDRRASPEELAGWAFATQRSSGRLPLICSSADPDAVRAAQARFGQDKVSHAIEGFFAETARHLRARGVSRLIVAGGETSGAVVSALQIAAFGIGPEIDPGVPALRVAGAALTLALKSGNFGSRDFFAKAARVLEGAAEERAA